MNNYSLREQVEITSDLVKKYKGKKFSILGDSISTLVGYNPDGYKVFYEDENCLKSKVREMKDTWWGKVINALGGELLVNNSWSGSRVTKSVGSKRVFPAGCSDERTNGLHVNNIMPDVIIIYLGMNDWANKVPCYGDTVILGEPACIVFENAYSEMLMKLKQNYPNAEIWCCTLNETTMTKNPSFKFPHSHGGTHIKRYNRIIIDTAFSFNCRFLDLYEYSQPYDSIDGSHPNENGMNTLAVTMIKELIKQEEDSRIITVPLLMEDEDAVPFYTHYKATWAEELVGIIVEGKYTYSVESLIKCINETATYRVNLILLGVPFLLKVFNKEQDFSRIKENMVVSETMLQASFDCDGIPRILDIFYDDKLTYIVMEYVDGITIDKKVAKINDISTREECVAKYAIQIAEILKYLHSLNPPVIHRDIKPSNIMVSNMGEVKLIDFGIARRYDPDKTCDTAIIGTRGYAPPEQYGKRQTDQRSDIFALGMTMYELVTGVDLKSVENVYRSICEMNSKHSKGLEYIISKCIEIEPKNRYQNVDELIADLNNYHNLPKPKGFLKRLLGK